MFVLPKYNQSSLQIVRLELISRLTGNHVLKML
uniref:Uncharacterized protein n=1 Tax=Anguilla anguilla TaxID=7936 RepID=A0A0E9XCI6_ANGAN